MLESQPDETEDHPKYKNFAQNMRLNYSVAELKLRQGNTEKKMNEIVKNLTGSISQLRQTQNATVEFTVDNKLNNLIHENRALSREITRIHRQEAAVYKSMEALRQPYNNQKVKLGHYD